KWPCSHRQCHIANAGTPCRQQRKQSPHGIEAIVAAVRHEMLAGVVNNQIAPTEAAVVKKATWIMRVAHQLGVFVQGVMAEFMPRLAGSHGTESHLSGLRKARLRG